MAADVATLAAELAAHADAEARIAAALVELERHPGHVALAAGTSTGVTAARWAAASAELAALWEDFAAYRSALDDARARPAERHRLLRGATVEVAGETLTLDALATRMVTTLREVTAVVAACDDTHRAVFTALVPLADRARNALAAARDLDPEGADTARLAGALADVERALVHDPLALADFSVEEVLAPLADALGPVTARCAELAAARDGWTAGIAELETALAAAAALHVEADRAGRRAQELIADADPPVPDPLPALRARLAALPRIPRVARAGRGGAGSAGRRRGHDGRAAHCRRRGRGVGRAPRRAARAVRRLPGQGGAARRRRAAGRARGGRPGARPAVDPSVRPRGGHRGGRRVPAAGPGRRMTGVSIDACRRPGCGGAIDDGYCDECGHPAAGAGPGGGSGPAPADASGPGTAAAGPPTARRYRAAPVARPQARPDGSTDRRPRRSGPHRRRRPAPWPPTGAAGPPTGAGTGPLSPSDQAARWAEGTRQAGSRGSGRSGRGSGRTTASGSTRGRLGAGLVDVPAVPARRPGQPRC